MQFNQSQLSSGDTLLTWGIRYLYPSLVNRMTWRHFLFSDWDSPSQRTVNTKGDAGTEDTKVIKNQELKE